MSTAYAVVDTNVPIVANGANENVCAECRLRTIDFLEDFSKNGKLVIDVEGRVEEEYRRNLSAGYPGVGNRFIQHFLFQSAHKVERIQIGGTDSKEEYDHIKFAGALRNFDRSDRKFAALSVAAKAPVVVSVDSDWVISKSDLEKAGVKIEFLCGENQKQWYK